MTPVRVSLIRHPDSKGDAIEAIEVAVTREDANALHLAYNATGDFARVVLPELTASTRADDLWRTTCFEAFARAQGAKGYFEFNLSPSTRWAAYRLEAYRAGLTPAEAAPPRIAMTRDPNLLELTATLDLSHIPDFTRRARLSIALSAVIEETDGAMSYWALTHAPGRPDFHHTDCFALELDLADLE